MGYLLCPNPAFGGFAVNKEITMSNLFGGLTFDPVLDQERMKIQLGRVFCEMRDQDWHTIPELQQKCGGSEAAISARIRDLRKPQFGSYEIITQRVKAGLWRYRLILSN